MKRPLLGTTCLLALSLTVHAAPPDVGSAASEPQFRELYKELVETNTTLSSGSCTLAAERMAAHLKAAGFPDSDLHPFAAPDHPKVANCPRQPGPITPGHQNGLGLLGGRDLAGVLPKSVPSSKGSDAR